MKTLTRKFVVEFKPGRRQRKVSPASIWGDADLKSLAREVEEQSSHLFKSSEPPRSSVSVEAIQPDPIPASMTSELANDVGITKPLIEPAQAQVAQVPIEGQVDRPAPAAAVFEQVRLPTLRPRKKPKSQGMKRATVEHDDARTNSADAVGDDEHAPEVVVAGSVSFSDVAALDTENQRLKRLLVERLRAENMQLTKMLERCNRPIGTACRIAP
ncbi:hypothetical protein ASD00_30950 [Ensifer sp. Root31]|uniref:hypothetical protein n=1 Tax=Ensifer sp. Root31 TaxID=1736512 RepID=UPI00070DBD38|nr:hypothetical protein [Ensifer sp. Root31]KQU86321.1 hypothetical protein ASD00_30950 [Ensifer sp. Root31]